MEWPPSSETFETRVPLVGPSFATAMKPRAFACETDMLYEQRWPSLPSKFPPPSQISTVDETSTVPATEIEADEKLLVIKSDAESTGKSNTSKTSKGSKIRLAMAQLKMEQLKQEQKLQTETTCSGNGALADGEGAFKGSYGSITSRN